MAEANDFRTTLRTAITADAVSLVLTSIIGSGINGVPATPFRIRIGNELLLVTARAGFNCTVTRGIEGSVAAAHSAGAVVRQVLTVAGLTALFADSTGPLGPASTTDNAIARWDGTDGSALQDSLPVVEDDGRISSVTDPVGDQDATTKAYVDAAVAGVGGGGGEVAQNSFLVSGGQVVWVEDYVFLVSAATYYIGGVLFTSPQTEVELDPADGSNDRIDVIAVNGDGEVEVIAGTAAAQPSTPDVDPGSQLQLAIILVETGTTEPGGADTEIVYDETGGAEWTPATSGSGWTTAATGNPYHGTNHVEATNVAANAYVEFETGSPIDPAEWDNLVFNLKPKASWPNNRTLVVTLRDANGVQIGSPITVTNGSFGFNSATLTYQQISIPMVSFAATPGSAVAIVRFTRQGPSTIGFYLDYVLFQSGAVVQQPVGITQDQADARYLRRSLNLADVTDAAQARANIGAGTGGGDVSGPASSVDSEVAIFNGITGKIIKRASGTGVAKLTAGVLSAGTVSLTTEVSGDLPLSSLAQAGAASRILGRGSAAGAGDYQDLTVGTGLQISGTVLSAVSGVAIRTIEFDFDGGGEDIPAGTKAYLTGTPFAGTITGAFMIADAAGSIVADIWKEASGSIPDNSDSITAAAQPTLSTDQLAEDTTLTGWTTSVVVGDNWICNIDSCSGITKFKLVLRVSVTG